MANWKVYTMLIFMWMLTYYFSVISVITPIHIP